MIVNDELKTVLPTLKVINVVAENLEPSLVQVVHPEVHRDAGVLKGKAETQRTGSEWTTRHTRYVLEANGCC